MRVRCFFLLIGFLLGPMGDEAQQTKLRVTLQLPISNHLGVNLMEFKKEVERRSERAIAVEIYDNSRLFNDSEALGAVSSGAIEMATITYQGTSNNAPS